MGVLSSVKAPAFTLLCCSQFSLQMSNNVHLYQDLYLQIQVCLLVSVTSAVSLIGKKDHISDIVLKGFNNIQSCILINCCGSRASAIFAYL